MVRVVSVAVIVIIILTPSVFTVNQETQFIVYRLFNLTLESDEAHETDLLLEAYAPHTIASDICPIDPSIDEALVSIDLNSEMDGVGILHRGDTYHVNGSFVPSVSDYHLIILNKGYLEEVRVNLTLVRTGPSQNEFTSPWYLFESVMGIIIVMTIAPLALLTIGVLVYRKRKS